MDAFFFLDIYYQNKMPGSTKDHFTGCTDKQQTGAGYKEKFEAAERMKKQTAGSHCWKHKVSKKRTPSKKRSSMKGKKGKKGKKSKKSKRGGKK